MYICINFVHAGFGATVNVAKPKPNDTVAVFGLGAVGLAVCYIPFTAFSRNKLKDYNGYSSYLVLCIF